MTPRELDLLRELREGKSNKAIAHALGIVEGTVKVYFSKLAYKLGGMTRVQMALWSQRETLMEPGPGW